MTKIWFRRKIYGWGWYPATWEGWLTMLIWLILFVFGVIKTDHDWFENVFVILLMFGILIWICYIKGEKPRWQWGKRLND
jgi:uncharacterized membrane protein YhaH (DUF805 family)